VKPLPGRLVLLGHPVAHSLSPRFQNAALRRAGIPLVYEAVDVPAERLAGTVRELRSVAAAGNVTIPHKQAVAALCDELTPLARRAGAVNTFWCDGELLIGDNTDVGGIEAATAELFGAGPEHLPRRVALLGAGGAAAAVLTAAERWRDVRERLFSRSLERARRLADRFGRVASPAERLEDALSGAGLVVNATPLGLRGDDALPVDLERLDPHAAVLDLVYRQGGTRWVRAARDAGLRAADGTTVLLEQGALAFERWFGIPADREAMRAALGAS
jgi:shikimate dehydrogenase